MTTKQLYNQHYNELHDVQAAALLTLADVIAGEREHKATGLLTVAQAAKQFNLSKRTVYRMLDDGLSYVKARGAIRIKATDLQKYLDRGETLFG